MIQQPPRSTLFPYNDALPICRCVPAPIRTSSVEPQAGHVPPRGSERRVRSEEHTFELQPRRDLVLGLLPEKKKYIASRPDSSNHKFTKDETCLSRTATATACT